MLKNLNFSWKGLADILVKTLPETARNTLVSGGPRSKYLLHRKATVSVGLGSSAFRFSTHRVYCCLTAGVGVRLCLCMCVRVGLTYHTSDL